MIKVEPLTAAEFRNNAERITELRLMLANARSELESKTLREKIDQREMLAKQNQRAGFCACLETPISEDVYRDAVIRLLKLALKDTGGSRVLAQVLLSAYNGYEFQLDVTDLCLLDFDLYVDALIVIRGRVELRREPHEISGCNDHFVILWDRWFSVLHVSTRSKREE